MKYFSRATTIENPSAGKATPSPSSPSDSKTEIGYTPRALFAVSSLGLGHATRTLVVIREYLRRGYQITVVSAGNALAFLRLELEGEAAVGFREMADYPPLERGAGWRLYWYLFIDLLHTWRLIRSEHRQVQAIAGEYVSSSATAAMASTACWPLRSSCHIRSPSFRRRACVKLPG
jgi:UDP:flavonoid glycosyltransferase YjiC (YdhE family)